jgi:hypothetical protein
LLAWPKINEFQPCIPCVIDQSTVVKRNCNSFRVIIGVTFYIRGRSNVECSLMYVALDHEHWLSLFFRVIWNVVKNMNKGKFVLSQIEGHSLSMISGDIKYFWSCSWAVMKILYDSRICIYF